MTDPLRDLEALVALMPFAAVLGVTLDAARPGGRRVAQVTQTQAVLAATA